MQETQVHTIRAAGMFLEFLKLCVMKKWRVKMKFTAVALLSCCVAYTQDGNAGIQEANQKVRSYFQSGTQLLYAVGAIVGLIGAVKVFNKWNAGEPDTGRVAAAWFGSCVFLVVVTTVLRAFFGI